MSSELSLLASQLLSVSIAGGLNLYATVALLGVASRFGWIQTLPPALLGLENELIIASAGALFLIEFVVDKIPHLDSLWDALHTFIRPIATALLALGALATQEPVLQIGGALLAGSVALATHMAKAGFRMARNARPGTAANKGISLAEDAAALVLAGVVLRFSAAAPWIAGGFIVLALLLAPRLLRAFILGIRALSAFLRGFFGTAQWHDVDEVPPRLRALLPPQPIAQAAPRAARAALSGPAGVVGAFRNGWLVVTGEGPFFVYRTILGPRRIQLPPGLDVRVHRGPWADTMEVEAERMRYTLFLLKDGPSGERVLPEIQVVQG